MLSASRVERLVDRSAEDLLPVLAEGDDGVVVESDFLAAKLAFVDLRPLLDLVAEDDPVRSTEQLQHGEELAVGVRIAIDRLIDAGPEHLPEVGTRHPARRDVIAVRGGAELRIEG